MRYPLRAATFAALLASAMLTPLAAAPADQVRMRIVGFKELGAAFKRLNDTLRGNGQPAVLQQSAKAIRQAAQHQYDWFPAASRPAAGVKTAARPEIWTKGREFRAAQDAFTRQAAVLERTTAGGDMSAVRAEARKLGATCKACHDNFRVESD